MRTGSTWFDDFDDFLSDTGHWTIEYTTSYGEKIRTTIPYTPMSQTEPPELQEGDTTVLDEFLMGFRNAKE